MSNPDNTRYSFKDSKEAGDKMNLSELCLDLEHSRNLVDAGIELDTYFSWKHSKRETFIAPTPDVAPEYRYPAPTLEELFQEFNKYEHRLLIETAEDNKCGIANLLILYKRR